MGILNTVKNLFSKKKKFDKEVIIKQKVDEYGDLSATLLSFSDASYMSSLAAKMCIGQEPDEDYEKRLDHISRVVNRGHESTIAHSNIVILLLMDKNFSEKFTEVSNALKFTDYAVSKQEDESIAILIGGSIRAYKYFFREVRDLSNPICTVIKETLYQSAESVFFEDFIADGIMDKEKCRFYPITSTEDKLEELTDAEGKKYEESFCDAVKKERVVIKGKVCDILSADDVLGILDRTEQYGFTLRDVLKLTSCTIVFHDISRAIANQITRHFAGICQESQRYVDYSKSNFIDPSQFNIEKYPDKDKKYEIDINGILLSIKSQELGDLLQSIYPQLISQGMLKQDARGYLPFNVASRLVMTFTFADLIHFIKERRSPAAQPEVRVATDELINNLYTYDLTAFLFTSNGIDNLITLCETPVYKSKKEKELLDLDNSIDEVLEEVIE